ncbi:MAG: hypothetical protein PHE63_12425 [Eubacteriales bacterium]|nr:hypothetical protein [Eubacteriales bacterium]
MKKLLRSLLCFSLALTLLFGASITAFAIENASESSFTVFSEDFPDAYIITDTSAGGSCERSGDGEISLGEVQATVFIEEAYDFIDGEMVITESRLLSEEEVMAIGVENFGLIEEQREEFANSSIARAATSSRGKLSISFSGTYKMVGNGVSCTLTGNATWSGFNLLYSPENNPAAGKDFIGVCWAGGHQMSSSSISATWSGGGYQTVYLSEATPNAGRVWEFDEYKNNIMEVLYVKAVNLSATITKNTLTGGGNRAEAVLKYIHTYQATVGSISISASPSSVGTGFSLSNTSKQWSISCAVTNIPY